MLAVSRQSTATARWQAYAYHRDTACAIASTSQGCDRRRRMKTVASQLVYRQMSTTTPCQATQEKVASTSSASSHDAGPNFNLNRQAPQQVASVQSVPSIEPSASKPAVPAAKLKAEKIAKNTRKKRKKEIRAARLLKRRQHQLRDKKISAQKKLEKANAALKSLEKQEKSQANEQPKKEAPASPQPAAEQVQPPPQKPNSVIGSIMSKLKGEDRQSDVTEDKGDDKGGNTGIPHNVMMLRGRDPRSREHKAAVNAQTVEEGRQKRSYSDVTSPEQESYQRLVTDVPGSGAGYKINYLDFEATEMRYPPREIYPPDLPSLGDTDIVFAARVFNVHRYTEVEWTSAKPGKPAHWRRTMRHTAYYEERHMFEHLDGEQTFEYIGDSVLHLISRSILMARFPKRAPYAYNVGANFLVSNDVFGHIYDDAGLEKERFRVYDKLTRENVERAIEQAIREGGLSEAEIQERREAPIPEFNISISHQRKADLFESYTGALYLTRGFNEASRWTTQLFEPWIDRVARTPRYQSDATYTAAGLAEHKAQQAQIKRKEEQRSRARLLELGPVQRLVRSMLMTVLPRRLFPELRSKKRQEEES